MSEFFINLSPGCRVIRSGKNPVDLRNLPSDQVCKRLYLSGFSHIGIKPAAAKILKGYPASMIERLISLRKSEGKLDEVEILESLLKTKSTASSKIPSSKKKK